MAKETSIAVMPPSETVGLIGHETATAQFIDEAARGTLHHAYLITGAKGIGKATFAYHAARYMLAQGSVQESPSLSLFGDAPSAPPAAFSMTPDHPIFRRVAAGSHADLLVLRTSVDAKKGTERLEITAEEARAVPEFLSLTPAEGEWRIVIVDAVDQLNTHAANALLKILEEPPPRALLFLVCHAPGSALATIRSRCRLLKLSTPPLSAFEQILGRSAPTLGRADYTALYALSYGSPGYAITLAENHGVALYAAWLQAMLPQSSAQGLATLDKTLNGKNPKLWDGVLHGWRVLMHRLALMPALLPAIVPDEQAALIAIAQQVPPRQRLAWQQAGEALIAQTETFHLDKRQTIRLLLDPARLDSLKVA